MKIWGQSILDGKIPNNDAGIGWYLCIDEYQTDIYGKYHWGIHFARWMISYSSRWRFNWCNYFATGLGG